MQGKSSYHGLAPGFLIQDNFMNQGMMQENSHLDSVVFGGHLTSDPFFHVAEFYAASYWCCTASVVVTIYRLSHLSCRVV